jgi:hypothetical protein
MFRREPVLFVAQQQTDGWLVFLRLDLRVNSRKVEVQLACVLGFERRRFQFDNDIATPRRVRFPRASVLAGRVTEREPFVGLGHTAKLNTDVCASA